MNGIQLVASWLTPTVLFCFLNLMIGAIYIMSTLNPHRKQPNLGDTNEDYHPQLVRVPSFFERVKCINLSRNPPHQPDPTHYTATAEDHAARQQELDVETEEPHHVTRSKSDTPIKTTPARVLKKSASEKVSEDKVEWDERRPATVREKKASAVEDEAVDEKADDFINKFRQQLKLQRLDSILRYKEMLNRGMAR